VIADRLGVGSDEHDSKVSLALLQRPGLRVPLLWICLLVVAGAGLCSAMLA
jgi:hypothetical protein